MAQEFTQSSTSTSSSSSSTATSEERVQQRDFYRTERQIAAQQSEITRLERKLRERERVGLNSSGTQRRLDEARARVAQLEGERSSNVSRVGAETYNTRVQQGYQRRVENFKTNPKDYRSGGSSQVGRREYTPSVTYGGFSNLRSQTKSASVSQEYRATPSFSSAFLSPSTSPAPSATPLLVSKLTPATPTFFGESLARQAQARRVQTDLNVQVEARRAFQAQPFLYRAAGVNEPNSALAFNRPLNRANNASPVSEFSRTKNLPRYSSSVGFSTPTGFVQQYTVQEGGTPTPSPTSFAAQRQQDTARLERNVGAAANSFAQNTKTVFSSDARVGVLERAKAFSNLSPLGVATKSETNAAAFSLTAPLFTQPGRLIENRAIREQRTDAFSERSQFSQSVSRGEKLVGERLRTQPVELQRSLALAYVGGRVAGAIYRAGTNYLARSTNIATASGANRILGTGVTAALGGSFLINPAGTIRASPEIVAGGVGFAQGYGRSISRFQFSDVSRGRKAPGPAVSDEGFVVRGAVERPYTYTMFGVQSGGRATTAFEFIGKPGRVDGQLAVSGSGRTSLRIGDRNVVRRQSFAGVFESTPRQFTIIDARGRPVTTSVAGEATYIRDSRAGREFSSSQAGLTFDRAGRVTSTTRADVYTTELLTGKGTNSATKGISVLDRSGRLTNFDRESFSFNRAGRSIDKDGGFTGLQRAGSIIDKDGRLINIDSTGRSIGNTPRSFDNALKKNSPTRDIAVNNPELRRVTQLRRADVPFDRVSPKIRTAETRLYESVSFGSRAEQFPPGFDQQATFSRAFSYTRPRSVPRVGRRGQIAFTRPDSTFDPFDVGGIPRTEPVGRITQARNPARTLPVTLPVPTIPSGSLVFAGAFGTAFSRTQPGFIGASRTLSSQTTITDAGFFSGPRAPARDTSTPNSGATDLGLSSSTNIPVPGDASGTNIFVPTGQGFFPPPPPPPPPTPFIGVPPFPNLPLFGTGTSPNTRSRGPARGFKYTPSLTAGVFNIRGTRQRTITGVEVRPITNRIASTGRAERVSRRRRKRR